MQQPGHMAPSCHSLGSIACAAMAGQVAEISAFHWRKSSSTFASMTEWSQAYSESRPATAAHGIWCNARSRCTLTMQYAHHAISSKGLVEGTHKYAAPKASHGTWPSSGDLQLIEVSEQDPSYRLGLPTSFQTDALLQSGSHARGPDTLSSAGVHKRLASTSPPGIDGSIDARQHSIPGPCSALGDQGDARLVCSNDLKRRLGPELAPAAGDPAGVATELMELDLQSQPASRNRGSACSCGPGAERYGCLKMMVAQLGWRNRGCITMIGDKLSGHILALHAVWPSTRAGLQLEASMKAGADCIWMCQWLSKARLLVASGCRFGGAPSCGRWCC